MLANHSFSSIILQILLPRIDVLDTSSTTSSTPPLHSLGPCDPAPNTDYDCRYTKVCNGPSNKGLVLRGLSSGAVDWPASSTPDIAGGLTNHNQRYVELKVGAVGLSAKCSCVFGGAVPGAGADLGPENPVENSMTTNAENYNAWPWTLTSSFSDAGAPCRSALDSFLPNYNTVSVFVRFEFAPLVVGKFDYGPWSVCVGTCETGGGRTRKLVCSLRDGVELLAGGQVGDGRTSLQDA